MGIFTIQSLGFCCPVIYALVFGAEDPGLDFHPGTADCAFKRYIRREFIFILQYKWVPTLVEELNLR